jgi:hypothetical protein
MRRRIGAMRRMRGENARSGFDGKTRSNLVAGPHTRLERQTSAQRSGAQGAQTLA